MNRRVPAMLVILGLAIGVPEPTGLDASAAVRPINRLVVFDAKGVTLGAVFFDVNQPEVVLEINGRLLSIRADRNRLFAEGALLFESSDCTGSPLTDPATDFVLPFAAIAPPGTTVYLPQQGATPQPITANSAFNSAPTFGCEQISPPATFLLVSAVAVIDLDTLFTPPFSVRPALW